MKPFDLEAAKAGAPVVTSDGSEVIISLFDARDKEYPLMGFVRGKVSDWYCFWRIDGTYLGQERYNLYMKTVKKSGWANKEWISDCQEYVSNPVFVEWEE